MVVLANTCGLLDITSIEVHHGPLRAFTSVRANFLSILHEKTYSFYFTLSLLQNTHISSSILQDISIKYSLVTIFLLFLSTTSLYTRSLSLFLPIFLLCCSLSTPISLATAPPDHLWPSSSKSQNPSTFLFHHHHKISTTTKYQPHTHSIAP